MTRDTLYSFIIQTLSRIRPSLDVSLSLLAASRYLDKAGHKIKIIKDNLYENHLDVLKEDKKNNEKIMI